MSATTQQLTISPDRDEDQHSTLEQMDHSQDDSLQDLSRLTASPLDESSLPADDPDGTSLPPMQKMEREMRGEMQPRQMQRLMDGFRELLVAPRVDPPPRSMREFSKRASPGDLHQLGVQQDGESLITKQMRTLLGNADRKKLNHQLEKIYTRKFSGEGSPDDNVDKNSDEVRSEADHMRMALSVLKQIQDAPPKMMEARAEELEAWLNQQLEDPIRAEIALKPPQPDDKAARQDRSGEVDITIAPNTTHVHDTLDADMTQSPKNNDQEQREDLSMLQDETRKEEGQRGKKGKKGNKDTGSNDVSGAIEDVNGGNGSGPKLAGQNAEGGGDAVSGDGKGNAGRGEATEPSHLSTMPDMVSPEKAEAPQNRSAQTVPVVKEPQLSPLSPPDASSSLSKAEHVAVKHQTGQSISKHNALSQQYLSELTATTTATAQGIKSAISQSKSTILSEIDTIKGELLGGVSAARQQVETARASRCGAVSDAASKARADTDAHLNYFRSLLGLEQRSRAEETENAYQFTVENTRKTSEAAGQAFQKMFQESYTSIYGTRDKNTQKLSAGWVRSQFASSGDPLQKYLGVIRGNWAVNQIPTEKQSIASGASSVVSGLQASLTEASRSVSTLIGTLWQALNDSRTSEKHQIEHILAETAKKLDADHFTIHEDINEAEQTALMEVNAEAAALNEKLDTEAAQVELDASSKRQDIEVQYTTLSNTYAGSIESHEQSNQAFIDGPFKPSKRVKTFTQKRTAELGSLRTASAGELSAMDEATRQNLQQHWKSPQAEQSKNTGKSGATTITNIGENHVSAMHGAGQTMKIAGGLLEQDLYDQMPEGSTLEQNITHYEGILQKRIVKLTGALDQDLGKTKSRYGQNLAQAVDQKFIKDCLPGANAEADKKWQNIDSRIRRCYKAMKGWGTDENAVYNALRNQPKGMPPALRARWRQVYPGTIESWIRDDFSDEELDIALGHLRRSPSANRLEVRMNMRWGEGRRVEEILRALPDQERANLKNDPEWQTLYGEAKGEIEGRDWDVFDALFHDNIARADALRLQELLDQLNDGDEVEDFDAVIQMLESWDSEQLTNAVGAFATLGGEDLSQQGLTPQQYLKQYITQCDALKNASGASREAYAGLADALISSDGNDQFYEMTIRAYKLRIETLREDIDPAAVERLLYTSPELRDAAHASFSDDPERRELAEVQGEIQQTQDAFETVYTTLFDDTGSIDQAVDKLDLPDEQKDLYKKMFQDGTNTPEVAALQIHLACDGIGTDEDAILRALEGMHLTEIEQLKTEYADLKGSNQESLTDQSLEETLEEELGGDELHTVNKLITLGDKQFLDEVGLYKLAKMDFEHSDSGLKGSDEHDMMVENWEALQASYKKNFHEDGTFNGTDEEYQAWKASAEGVDFKARLRASDMSTESNQLHKEAVANVATTIVSVVGAVAATAFTAGMATTALSAALISGGLTAGTGLANMAINEGVKGDSYSGEDALGDLAVTAGTSVIAGATAAAGHAIDAMKIGGKAAAVGGTATKGGSQAVTQTGTKAASQAGTTALTETAKGGSKLAMKKFGLNVLVGTGQGGAEGAINGLASDQDTDGVGQDILTGLVTGGVGAGMGDLTSDLGDTLGGKLAGKINMNAKLRPGMEMGTRGIYDGGSSVVENLVNTAVESGISGENFADNVNDSAGNYLIDSGSALLRSTGVSYAKHHKGKGLRNATASLEKTEKNIHDLNTSIQADSKRQQELRRQLQDYNELRERAKNTGGRTGESLSKQWHSKYSTSKQELDSLSARLKDNKDTLHRESEMQEKHQKKIKVLEASQKDNDDQIDNADKMVEELAGGLGGAMISPVVTTDDEPQEDRTSAASDALDLDSMLQKVDRWKKNRNTNHASDIEEELAP